MALTLQQLQSLDLGYISGSNLLQFCPAQLLLNQSAIGIDFNDSLLISQTEMISELSNQYDFTAEYLKLSTANPDTREQLVLKLTTIGTIINILGSMAGVNDQMQYWFKWYSDNIEKIKKRSRKLGLPIAVCWQLADAKLIHARFSSETDYPGWINRQKFI